MEKKAVFADKKGALAILGEKDAHLQMLCGSFSCQITSRGDDLVVKGSQEETAKVERLVKELLFLHKQGNSITTHEVRYSIGLINRG